MLPHWFGIDHPCRPGLALNDKEEVGLFGRRFVRRVFKTDVNAAFMPPCSRMKCVPAGLHRRPFDVHLFAVGWTSSFTMKKVSTGERIKFADLRRRSVGVSRDADSDAAQSEQRFVSELMDTTPSSSYEGETLRDGYVYNPPDPSVSDSPLARYESDGEGADEVVTGTQEGVGKADLIVKEDVPEVKAKWRVTTRYVLCEVLVCARAFQLKFYSS